MPNAAGLPGYDACWRKIGVWGRERPRCNELDRVIHCHNCERFSEAARDVFESMPVTALSEENVLPELDVAAGDQSLVPFRVGSRWFGLAPGSIMTIVNPPSVHSIPHRCDNLLLGVTAVSGELVMSIDARKLLAVATPRQDPRYDETAASIPRFMVMQLDGRKVGFTVDEVCGVEPYYEFELTPIEERAVDYVDGVLSRESRCLWRLNEAVLAMRLRQEIG